jgi:anti-sigma regulatory factor (Ser/Thr protein kinase)
MTAPAPLELQVPGEAAALEPARQAVLAHLERLLGAPLPPRLAYRLELVLEEALMNRAWHAWPQDPDHPGPHHTRLSVHAGPDAVVLDFDDDGRPFDPLQAADPQRPASLDQARPGGLGLMLSRKAARAMHYERRDGRNRLRVEIARE